MIDRGRRSKWIGIVIVLTAWTIIAASDGGPTTSAYGAKVRYRNGEAVVFPDFMLTYLGERRVKSPVYPRGFLYHDFQITNGATQTVSWSSGAGDIAPTEFKVGRKRYNLELSRSDRNGRLGSDELVVNQLGR